MPVELKVIIKDEESRKLTKDFLLYDKFEMVEGDPKLEACVQDLINEFRGHPDTVNLIAKMVWK